mmetsp:Transcript_19315/g.36678  ORF Transcript_19315/g.36678 Transcript_19315/m.36678 type:complete len:351 (+) Transcript_19315:1065-2117(+)
MVLLLLLLFDLEPPTISEIVLPLLLLLDLELPTASDTGFVHPSSSHPGPSTAGGSIGLTGDLLDFELVTISPMDSVPLLDFELVPPTIPETSLLLFDLELAPSTISDVLLLLLLLLFDFEPLTTSEMVLLLLLFDLELVSMPSTGSTVLSLDDLEDFIAAILLLLPFDSLLLFDLELAPSTISDVLLLLLLLLFDFEPLTTSEMVLLLLLFDLELVSMPSTGSTVLSLDDLEDFIAAILLLLPFDFDELPPIFDVPLADFKEVTETTGCSGLGWKPSSAQPDAQSSFQVGLAVGLLVGAEVSMAGPSSVHPSSLHSLGQIHEMVGSGVGSGVGALVGSGVGAGTFGGTPP